MRIVCISDTHGYKPRLPKGEMLIHAGDICPRGQRTDFIAQLKWLESVREDFPKGIYLSPGNHDEIVEEEPRWAKEEASSYGVNLVIHEAREIEGIKFFFSPYSPKFYDWAYMKSDEELKPVWEEIPVDTEVLVTHGPAMWIRDLCRNGHVGSKTLFNRIFHLKDLKAHVSGHIHEAHGFSREGSDNARYWAINAAMLDGYYSGFNDAHILDTNEWDVTQEPEPRRALVE